MEQIGIIGAGQLGSRHLQGVLKSSLEFEVNVVDPNKSSLEVAESRAKEIEHTHKVNFEDNIKELPKELDLVIIATNSDVRHRVLKELLNHSSVDSLVLEKVLFQSLSEYQEAYKVITSSGAKTYVNHARRMQALYHGLRNIIGEFAHEVFDVDYYGANWGLGCNGLHLSDAISFILNDSITSYENKELDPEVIDSKRKGFIEFTGTLSGKTKRGNHFRITSRRTEDGAPTGISLTINSPSVHISVMEGEANSIVRVTRINQGLETEMHKFPAMMFQSDLSKIIVEETFN